MNFDPNALLNWILALTPDKLAIVVPFVIAYAIIRTRKLDNVWIWPVCMALGSILFLLLEPASAIRTHAQDITFRICIGLLLGFIAALLSIGLHSGLFKPLASKFPVLQFLVLADESMNAGSDKN